MGINFSCFFLFRTFTTLLSCFIRTFSNINCPSRTHCTHYSIYYTSLFSFSSFLCTATTTVLPPTPTHTLIVTVTSLTGRIHRYSQRDDQYHNTNTPSCTYSSKAPHSPRWNLLRVPCTHTSQLLPEYCFGWVEMTADWRSGKQMLLFYHYLQQYSFIMQTKIKLIYFFVF